MTGAALVTTRAGISAANSGAAISTATLANRIFFINASMPRFVVIRWWRSLLPRRQAVGSKFATGDQKPCAYQSRILVVTRSYRGLNRLPPAGRAAAPIVFAKPHGVFYCF